MDHVYLVYEDDSSIPEGIFTSIEKAVEYITELVRNLTRRDMFDDGTMYIITQRHIDPTINVHSRCTDAEGLFPTLKSWKYDPKTNEVTEN